MCTGLAVHQCTLYMSSPRNVTHLRPNLSCVSSDRLNDGQIDHCDSHHPVLCYNESLHTGLTRGHQMRSEYPFIFSPIGQKANCKIWLLPPWLSPQCPRPAMLPILTAVQCSAYGIAIWFQLEAPNNWQSFEWRCPVLHYQELIRGNSPPVSSNYRWCVVYCCVYGVGFTI